MGLKLARRRKKSEGPAPDVARISLIYGDVTTQRGDTGDWSVTTVNAPVMRGDAVATGEIAKTEIFSSWTTPILCVLAASAAEGKGDC